jgi:DNA-binding transcriptional regulator YiaG
MDSRRVGGNARPVRTSDRVIAISLARRLVAAGIARQLRVGADLSLAEVGRAIGCEATTVRRWEIGERRLEAGDLAIRYADLLARLGEIVSVADPASESPQNDG